MSDFDCVISEAVNDVLSSPQGAQEQIQNAVLSAYEIQDMAKLKMIAWDQK